MAPGTKRKAPSATRSGPTAAAAADGRFDLSRFDDAQTDGVDVDDGGSRASELDDDNGDGDDDDDHAHHDDDDQDHDDDNDDDEQMSSDAELPTVPSKGRKRPSPTSATVADAGKAALKRRKLVSSGLPQFRQGLSSDSDSDSESDSDDDDGSDGEEAMPEAVTADAVQDRSAARADDDGAGIDLAAAVADEVAKKRPSIASLTPEALAALEAKRQRSGVLYLSRVPPFMKPQKVRHLLSPFGASGRIFLAPEDDKTYTRRVRSGGNKRRRYTEGWIEFPDKRRAKLVAQTLNTKPIGAVHAAFSAGLSTSSGGGGGGGRKKERFYADDLWNLKYLPKFKWDDLTAQVAGERRAREAKLRSELLQQERDDRHVVRQQARFQEMQAIERTRERRAAEKKAAAGPDGVAGVAAPEKKAGKAKDGGRPFAFRQNAAKDRTARPIGHSASASSTAPSSRQATDKAKLQTVMDSIF